MKLLFKIFIDNPKLKWNEFWISKNFKEYLKFRKFSRYDKLYDETLPFTKQDKLTMYAMLHNYFVYIGYNGPIVATDAEVRYLIWRYTILFPTT